ncbi:hypothetical protein DCAR_0518622 [Daucus carota subsp. sativus]|uniref:VQ domain-containing protein n=1 Tax=Daucus carota subsp. sativus TaxID=79200 RepID=A0A164XDH1_DAUCS|nr:PREDICTED: uncharacterized protein LOC108221143 [Daucus carota subsp. sativus]WOG99274.1 hypothetical protein DCAR_0518622 [Daucus carota subsp. sativus]
MSDACSSNTPKTNKNRNTNQNTTFVRTEPENFRDIVQRLTGPAPNFRDIVQRQTSQLNQNATPHGQNAFVPGNMMTEVSPSMLEDNAIANKGFYLYPNPLGTNSNNIEPQLLDLFPTSPEPKLLDLFPTSPDA